MADVAELVRQEVAAQTRALVAQEAATLQQQFQGALREALAAQQEQLSALHEELAATKLTLARAEKKLSKLAVCGPGPQAQAGQDADADAARLAGARDPQPGAQDSAEQAPSGEVLLAALPSALQAACVDGNTCQVGG